MAYRVLCYNDERTGVTVMGEETNDEYLHHHNKLLLSGLNPTTCTKNYQGLATILLY